MQSDLIHSLIDLGLTENEAKVYIAGIELGPTTILQLSKLSEVKRTTIYSVIDSLQKLNLIQIEFDGWKKLFKTQNPENLSQILDRRQHILESLIPKINSLNTTKKDKNELSYWEGLSAIKQVYNDLLADTEPFEDYLVLGNQEIWLELDKTFTKDFIARRSQKQLKIRLLLSDSEISREYQKNQAKHGVKIRLLPKNTILTTNLVITKNKVVIHQLLPPPTAIVSTNSSIIQTHRETFELLWQSCK
jgi:sugar-specific transcriptional regulator TrmB